VRGIGLPAIDQLTTEQPPVQLFDVAVYPSGSSATATRSAGLLTSVVRFPLPARAGGAAELVATQANNSGGAVRPIVHCRETRGGIDSPRDVILAQGHEATSALDILFVFLGFVDDRRISFRVDEQDEDGRHRVCEVPYDNQRVRIEMKGGDDRLTIDPSLLSTPGLAGVPVDAFLGPGDDTGAIAEVVIRAAHGAGSPYGLRGAAPGRVSGAGRLVYFHGGPGDDLLAGGRLNDRFVGGPGRDTMRGGPGADTFRARDGERDVVAGGRGIDSGRFDPIDRVTGVERRA
jgi:hypothetical protein